MIKNEKQYYTSKKQRESILNNINNIRSKPKTSLDEMEKQLISLDKEIKEYEELKLGKRKLSINSLEELPELLIKARIASGLSQQELANKLGLKQQQLQRYEATNFSCVSMFKISQIVKVLNLTSRSELLFFFNKT